MACDLSRPSEGGSTTPVSRPGTNRCRLVVALGVALGLVGIAAPWATSAGVSLRGIDPPHNGWIAAVYLVLGAAAAPWFLRCPRSAGVASTFAGVIAAATIAASRGIPGAEAQPGRWVSLVGSSLLIAAGAWLWGTHDGSGSMPPATTSIGARRFLSGLGAAASLILVFALWQVLALEERPSWPPPDDAISATGSRAAIERFAASDPRPRDTGLDFAWSTADTIEPLVDGNAFYPRILADIDRAESSVHIMMFGWRPGGVGSDLAALVERKLAGGVEVRIVTDEFGSGPHGRSAAMYRRLANAGAEIVVNDASWIDRDGLFPSRRLDWRQDELGRIDHRKLYVVDGVVAWTGGAGVEDHFQDRRFHDVMVRVTGDVVLQAQAVFLAGFAGHGGPLPDDLGKYFPKQPRSGVTPIAVVQVVPGGFVSATQAMRELIDGSQHRLDIMNSYLVDTDIVRRLIRASERGVKVRVVVSQTWNTGLASVALRHHYADLTGAGVAVWEYGEAIIHAKLIVADDRVMFGSVNVDTWSLYRDFEMAMIAEDAETAAALTELVFEPDIERSRPGVPLSGWAAFRSWAAQKLAYFL